MIEGKLAGFPWGVGCLVLLAVIYVVALGEVSPRLETGVRVIPWQAPDLEIQSPASTP